MNLKLDSPGDVLTVGRSVASPRRHVQVRLVQRDALDKLRRREPPEDLVDGATRVAVPGTVRRHHHQLRTDLEGLMQRHRGAHTERPGFIGGAHDHCALGSAGDGHGDASELRIVPLMDRRVKRVQVYVEDRSRPVVGSRHACVGASLPQHLVAFGPYTCCV
jgi:hypothetical protein